MKLSYALIGTAFLVMGAAAYIYLSSCYREEDASFDLLEENQDEYL